jgi:hypothetical protein
VLTEFCCAEQACFEMLDIVCKGRTKAANLTSVVLVVLRAQSLHRGQNDGSGEILASSKTEEISKGGLLRPIEAKAAIHHPADEAIVGEGGAQVSVQPLVVVVPLGLDFKTVARAGESCTCVHEYGMDAFAFRYQIFGPWAFDPRLNVDVVHDFVESISPI